MSKFEEKKAFYKAEMEELGIKVDDDLLHACTKACGPSIYNDDAAGSHKCYKCKYC